VSAHRITAISLLAVALIWSPSSHAGVYGDSLGKCLVSTSTDQDKHKLVQWVFAAIALNPSVSSYVNLPVENRTEIDKNMAGLFEKLLGDTCKAEASEALKYEGTSSFGVAFQLLGTVAGQQIFAAPEVAKGSEGFLKYLDTDGLQKKLGLVENKP
jgi:hypothetical protein